MSLTNRLLVTLVVALVAACAVVAEEPRKDLYGDPLPPGAVARIGTLRLRNTGEFSQVALSPDGKLLVTIDQPFDGFPHSQPLQVWDAETGILVREIRLPDEERDDDRPRPREDLAAMTFSPDSRRLHILTQKGNLRVYDQ